MPGDQRPDRAPGPQAARATPSRDLLQRDDAGKPAAGVGKLYAILGLSGSITLVVGAVLAIACTAWALTLDVPRQVAYLAGYITVAASACICAALVAVRHSAARAAIPQAAPQVASQAAVLAVPSAATAAPSASVTTMPRAAAPTEAVTVVPDPTEAAATKPAAKPSPRAAAKPAPKPAALSATEPAAESAAEPAPATPPASRSTEPDYDAWNGVDALRVADASRLWCGIEPGRPVNPEVMARARTILEAIEQGELPNNATTGVLAQYKIGWHTEVRRAALKAWAESKGPAPRFLRD